MAEPLLSLRGCSKTFASRPVLRGVDLDVHAGEIHALLGQNGSGKSTVIKILSGYYTPDPGATLQLHGEEISFPVPPGLPRKRGLAFVHQELGLAEDLTVLENLRVGRFDLGPGWRIRWRSERRRASKLLARFHLRCSPDAQLAELREIDRALLAIARGFGDLTAAGAGGVLVLDEPTAYLPHDSTERLLEAIRAAASAGVGVLFVTHRLREVEAVADTVSVLRDGRLTATEAATSLGEADLAERILGFRLDQLYPPDHVPRGELALAARDIAGDGVQPVTFDVHRGEVVGLTGLVGMGWERIPYLIFGADASATGSVQVGSRSCDVARLTPRDAMAAGLALLPADRQRDGAVDVATVAENLSLPTLHTYFRGGRLRHRRERARALQLLTDYDVQPRDPRAPFSTLSGGNKQRVLIAKWFETRPLAFLMHEPTHGVDVGARQQILEYISTSAQQGRAFVIASAEYEDLAHLCDRVLVFRDGQAVAQLAGRTLTHERLLDQCFRHEPLQSITGDTRGARNDNPNTPLPVRRERL